MKAKTAVLIKDHTAEVHERELGEIGDHQVLVKLDTCNLCTTDYQQWMGLREKQGYPMAGGHENSGIVVAAGKDVKNTVVGDRVAFGYIFCGDCPACRAGNTFECTNIDFDAVSPDGYKGDMGIATYKLADAKYTVKVSDQLKPAQAGFVEPLGTVIHGIKKLQIQPNEDVIVVGAGTMGLLNALTARAYGARVIVSELTEKKLKRAESMGFETIHANDTDPAATVLDLTGGKGADIVIGAVGATKAYDQCFQMLREHRGKFLVFAAGYPEPQLHISPNDIHYRQIQIIGTMGGGIGDFEEAAKLLSDRTIDVSGCLEGITIGLKDIQKAFEAASAPDAYRVTVDCQDV